MQESKKSRATQSERVSLGQLTRTPYILVLTYPRVSLVAARSRVRQLEKLGVKEIVFDGHTRIGRLGILGLGTVGLVVAAVRGQETIALKIRRLDANRPNMEEEVRIARLANRVGVGPEVYSRSKDFIVMKLLAYQELHMWLKELQGPGSRQVVRSMVHSILNQCRKLDIMGIDHGQLSNLRKHVVVAEDRAWIIDFESASTSRKTKNVTTAAQYLLIGGKVSPLLRRILGFRDKTTLLTLLAAYKRDGTDYAYSRILESVKLAGR